MYLLFNLLDLLIMLQVSEVLLQDNFHPLQFWSKHKHWSARHLLQTEEPLNFPIQKSLVLGT